MNELITHFDAFGFERIKEIGNRDGYVKRFQRRIAYENAFFVEKNPEKFFESFLKRGRKMPSGGEYIV